MGNELDHGIPTGALTLPTGDVRDFDFWVGAWNGVNRRLKKRWVGSEDWEVFPGTVRGESRTGRRTGRPS